MPQNKKLRFFALLPVLLLVAASCNPFSWFGGGGSSGPYGIFKTIDGGSSWHPSDAVEGSKKGTISGVSVAEMAFDPNSNSTIYLATVDNGIIVSKNSGDTWKQILSKVAAYDFYVDPKDSKAIFVAGTYNGHGRVVRTKDGGATWEELYDEASNNNTVHTLTVNPNNSQELYAALDSGTLIKSVDGGDHWFVIYDFKDLPLRIRFNKLNNTMYALLKTKGIKKSVDSGNTWAAITDPLFRQSPGIIKTIVGTVNGSNAPASAPVSPKVPQRFQRIAIDAQSTGVIYVTTDAGLFKTTDDGRTWAYLNVPAKTEDQVPYAVGTVNGGLVVYTSVRNTIMKSLDGGQSWQTQELPTDAIVSKILIDPANIQNVFAGMIAG